MQEDLITFETAKLTKDKGFEHNGSAYLGEGEYKGRIGMSSDCKIHYPAITQSLLQKWLREKHKIFVYCFPTGVIKGSGRHTNRWTTNMTVEKKKYSSTYEKALEAGLVKALKLIKL